MNEANPTLTAADKEAIAEFCQYERVTLTQFDAYRVKATFPDSADNEESVIGSSVVSVLLAVARRQKCLHISEGHAQWSSNSWKRCIKFLVC